MSVSTDETLLVLPGLGETGDGADIVDDDDSREDDNLGEGEDTKLFVVDAEESTTSTVKLVSVGSLEELSTAASSVTSSVISSWSLSLCSLIRRTRLNDDGRVLEDEGSSGLNAGNTRRPNVATGYEMTGSWWIEL